MKCGTCGVFISWFKPVIDGNSYNRCDEQIVTQLQQLLDCHRYLAEFSN